MARRRLYLETSFWRRLEDDSDARRRKITWGLLQVVRRDHVILVSDLVYDEIKNEKDRDTQLRVRRRLERTRKRALGLTPEVEDVAVALLREGGWTADRLADMLHLAYAVTGRADALATWNMKDLARPRMREVLRRVCRALGYNEPRVETPQEIGQWLGQKMPW